VEPGLLLDVGAGQAAPGGLGGRGGAHGEDEDGDDRAHGPASVRRSYDICIVVPAGPMP
jgi:hypothetical protein